MNPDFVGQAFPPAGWGRRFRLPLLGSMTWQAEGPAPQPVWEAITHASGRRDMR
jgi:hypothetical protein